MTDIIDITPERYAALLRRGEFLFSLIGDEVNLISNTHVKRDAMEWRRQSDFQEMCIALAILRERQER